MRKTLFFLLLLLGKCALGQLSVNTALTPNQLVQNIFLGSGVTVSNIVYTGGAASKASFSNGSTTNLGLNSGILLCTGNAAQIPNPATYFMSDNLGLAGDANLNNINNGCLTYDACILQFDFVPLSDTIKFKYVFGSEEYPNYICSQYNDVFAFFISGQNPAGGNYVNYNIALIPGTTMPVSVNSVNSGIPGSGFNSSGCLSLNYSNYFVNNAALNGASIAFGGFTTPLVAKCRVEPCETYHLKMAVADGYNGLYDSGVFLEANSFSTNTINVTTAYTDTLMGNYAIEGCSDGIISFTTPSPLTSSVTINYTVAGTASNGIDYITLPGSITIPAGQDSVGLLIHPLSDALTESNETVIISFTNGCITLYDTVNIMDKVNLSIAVGSDTAVCIGNAANLSATATGGIAPFTYTWNNGAGSGNPVAVNPIATTTYVVTVSDHCASTATDNITVTVDPMPVVSAIAMPVSVCNGQTSSLTASGASTFTWMPGNLSGSSINISPALTTTYTVTGSTNGGCSGTAIVTLTVNNISLAVSATPENCGNSDGTASAIATGSCAGSYDYAWNSLPSQTTATAENLPAGNYIVTVSCNGCSNTATVTVNEAPGLNADFMADPMATSITNPNINFIDITSGNVDQWWWNLGDGTTEILSEFNHTYGQTGNYLVTMLVTDTHGCIDSISKTIIINDFLTLYIPNAFTPNGDRVNDVFAPYGTNVDADHFEMTIFNRWGNMVYNTKNWTGSSCEGWNGTLNNSDSFKKAVTGVYVYKIHAGNESDGYKYYLGEVTLIQ
jgi:gliding motility-associated-like protein